jgi:hypothetical protein
MDVSEATSGKARGGDWTQKSLVDAPKCLRHCEAAIDAKNLSSNPHVSRARE